MMLLQNYDAIKLQRRSNIHFMKRIPLLTIILTTLLAASLRAGDHLVFEGKNGPGKGLHVVLLAGDEEYRSEEAMPMLAKILSERHGFRSTVCFSLDADGTISPNNNAGLSHPEALDSADVIVMSLRFRSWDDATMKKFTEAMKRGVPVVGLRTSTHAFNKLKGDFEKWNFNNNGGFGRQVLGETWVNHWGNHKHEATKGIIEESAKNDSILNGVEGIFGGSDVYEAYPQKDSKILVRGQVLKGMNPGDEPAAYKKKRASDKQEQGINDPMMPVAWTRELKTENGKSQRVFCTTMGAASDLTNEGLRRLVVNAVFWGLGLDVPKKADVAFVDPFDPTFYGFNGYRKGMKPDDFGAGKATTPADGAPQEPRKKGKKK